MFGQFQNSPLTVSYISERMKKKSIEIKDNSIYSEFFILLGWVQFGNHVYRIFTEQKTWNNAKVGDIKHIFIRKKIKFSLCIKMQLKF